MSSPMSNPGPTSVRSRLSLPARGLAEAAVQRARLTVVPRRRTRAPKVPFVTLVSALLLAGVVGLLLFNTSMQQSAFTITALQDQATRLAAREESLATDVERLRDPQNLGEAAQKAGMTTACAPVFLDLATGKVRGETRPCPASRLPLTTPPATRPEQLDPRDVLGPGAGNTAGGRPALSPAPGPDPRRAGATR